MNWGLTYMFNPEYSVWKSMIQRCHNPNCKDYEDYGLEGIKVCRHWKGTDGFKNFLNNMGERPIGKYHLDRIDADHGYAPWNCRWVTARENMLNRINTQWITFRGKTLCIKDWAKELNIIYETLHSRITKYGWSIEKALTTPSRNYKKG